MRRPPPLPAPPDVQDPSARAAGERSARERATGVPPEETDGDAMTEVAAPPGGWPDPTAARRPSPLGSPRPPASDDDDDAAPAAGDEEADAAASAGIGVREVWAAARARRKALRAEVRRFTVRQRRRRMVWIGAIGALVLLVLGSLGAAYSPLFAVEKVSVVGTSALDAGTVEQALSGQIGTPLPRVDSSAVKAALVQFPLVESYTLEARPPHELVVRIVERTPIGVIQSDAGFTLVDAAGVDLATTPLAPEGRPVITATGGVGSPAFASIGTVYRTLPADIRAQVTAMSATSANDVTLTLGGTGTQVVWGNADDSQLKARYLASAMIARPPADVYSYDVSAPEAVVIR